MIFNQKNYNGIFSLNRSESNLVIKIFSNYLFNRYIFKKHEGIKSLLKEIYNDDLSTEENIIDITYFFRPKDIFRQSCQEDSNNKSSRSIYSNGHFDIAIFVNSASSSHNRLILFETKYLSDINNGQLLSEIEMCKNLFSSSIDIEGTKIRFDEVCFINVTTWANLHFSRAIRVDSKGIVTIPGVGEMPEYVRVITYDKIAEIIIGLLSLSDLHKDAGTNLLRNMYSIADTKTLTIDGIPKGRPRNLLHTAKKQIEILGII